jgi:hypothetical protein
MDKLKKAMGGMRDRMSPEAPGGSMVPSIPPVPDMGQGVAPAGPGMAPMATPGVPPQVPGMEGGPGMGLTPEEEARRRMIPGLSGGR